MRVTVAVLAGGRGRRIGGAKALVKLGGLPLIDYPLRAAASTGLRAVVVAKPATELPALDVPVLIEPETLPTHPLSGILTALRSYARVLALPCDMPLVSAALLGTLAQAPGALVIAAPRQPFPGIYDRSLTSLVAGKLDARAPMRELLAEANVNVIEAAEPDQLLSVNTPADLERAAHRLWSSA